VRERTQSLAWPRVRRVPRGQFRPSDARWDLAAMLLAGAATTAGRADRVGFDSGFVFLALTWLGDRLDGTARPGSQTRQLPRYCFYVDHI